MGRIAALIVFTLVGLISPVRGEEVNIVSAYIERRGNSVWLNGGHAHVNMLIEAFEAKGFVVKEAIEGKKVACIIDTFAMLVVGRERGTAVNCPVTSNLDIWNNDSHYVDKVIEYVDWSLQYKESPFTGEAERNMTSFRSDQGRSCVFLETREFKKDKEMSRVYEVQSRGRFTALQHVLQSDGYVEKQANWTLCNAVFAKRRCLVEMDRIEGSQLVPTETVVSCYDADRMSVSEKRVQNDSPQGEYVDRVVAAIREGMERLAGVIEKK